jgi:hypothetical protein
MLLAEWWKSRLSTRDLDFLIETVSPEIKNRSRLRQIIKHDEGFRVSFVEDDAVVRRVLNDEEVFLKISPSLFFEILLRRAVRELSQAGYTMEKTSTMKIPVFDTAKVVELLQNEAVLVYLADMLSSFTRIESYTMAVRVRKGAWKKFRFNDLDIQSLTALCDIVEEDYRLGLYKRIADICLFTMGIFPDFVAREYQYPFSGQLRPQPPGVKRISPEEYEREGKKFYGLAAEHADADELDLCGVFQALHDNFDKAKKPLNFLADHYFAARRTTVFG